MFEGCSRIALGTYLFVNSSDKLSSWLCSVPFNAVSQHVAGTPASEPLGCFCENRRFLGPSPELLSAHL